MSRQHTRMPGAIFANSSTRGRRTFLVTPDDSQFPDLKPGWYTQREINGAKAEIVGPFATEEQAAEWRAGTLGTPW